MAKEEVFAQALGYLCMGAIITLPLMFAYHWWKSR